MKRHLVTIKKQLPKVCRRRRQTLGVSQVIFDEFSTRQKHNKYSAIWNALVRIYLTNYLGSFLWLWRRSHHNHKKLFFNRYLLQLIGGMAFLLPLSAWGQNYLWPAQIWQERDLVNPAAQHEYFPASMYRALVGASFRSKDFNKDKAEGTLADWKTAALWLEWFVPTKKNGSWLMGGRLYHDQFGATETNHGSVRIGRQQMIGNGENYLSSLTGAFRLGAESFRLRTHDLYFLQPGDPLQNENISAPYPVGGAGVIYDSRRKDMSFGFQAGVSLPMLLQPDFTAQKGDGYGWQTGFREWHGLFGGFARLGHGRWVDGSVWVKTAGAFRKEGSISFRYFNNWGSTKANNMQHGGNLWAGAGISTFGYITMEAGFMYDHLRLGFGYDFWLSSVSSIGSLPVQISVAWVGLGTPKK